MIAEAAIQNVKSNFYVDDWLSSVGNEQESAQFVREIDQLLTCGVFWLKKFSSNEPGAFEGIDSQRLAPYIADIELQGGDIPEQKSLDVI